MIIIVVLLSIALLLGFFILRRYKNKCSEYEGKLIESLTKNSQINDEVQRLNRAVNEVADSYTKTISELKTSLSKELSFRKSSEIRTGMIMEKLVPFLDVFKHNPDNIIHLGQPIDIIAFDDDEIVIIEVKSGNAQLTSKQRNIKKLIEDGKVRFELIRLNVDTKKEEDK